MCEPVTINELAKLVDGQVVGDGRLLVSGVAPIQSACEGEITFLDNADRKKRLEDCAASAAIVPNNSELSIEGKPLIKVANPLAAFEIAARYFVPKHPEPKREISVHAFVSPTARIGKNVLIEPFVFVGDDAEIGDDSTIMSGAKIQTGCCVGQRTTIFSNVVLYENTIVGDDCILHSGCVIGAFGFGYRSSKEGHYLSLQLGNVRIGNSVEVGACSTIDRATFGSTIIGNGTKIDNLTQIGHNCSLGKSNLICAHTGIAGSTTTGDFVVMAGRVGVRDHVHIGTGAVLGAMAGIMEDIPSNSRYVGIPATPEKEQFKLQISLKKLPEMRKELKLMQQEIKRLEQQIEQLKIQQHIGE
ncbi:MAG: UDP-3-O-(3-hydroxymyristoyl)glucosamine N-acyltransferase [Planctomycetaceae bacterium]|nr:UDP-3-O-(3-hydroxymyristoyl)glucosamine N-acyltransferase [Planctomycetaceae bacterium]